MATAPDWANALPDAHAWLARPAPPDLASLPNVPAIYLLLDAAGAAIQLGTTQALRRLLITRLTGSPEQRKGKADVAEIARGVRWRSLTTAFEGHWWYYRLARALYPQEYRKLISFGPAWFLHADWAQPLPEIRISERIWCLPGEFSGPWATHKSCHEALTGLWDLFDLCRYPEQVRKSPHGTRCAYAEMGRCDAPCDGSATLGPYADRCRAAWRFIAGGSAAWRAAAAERMRQAAAALNFEQAGLFKQQIQFVERWQTEWQPNLRTTAQWDFVLALPATRRKAWKLLLFRRGELSDGPLVPERRLGRESVAWATEFLGADARQTPTDMRMEQTWLICSALGRCAAASLAVIPLCDAALPANLGQALVDHAARVRARRPLESAGPAAIMSAAEIPPETL
jgi:excinuclease UvrABC nuclease subunit